MFSFAKTFKLVNYSSTFTNENMKLQETDHGFYIRIFELCFL